MRVVKEIQDIVDEFVEKHKDLLNDEEDDEHSSYNITIFWTDYKSRSCHTFMGFVNTIELGKKVAHELCDLLEAKDLILEQDEDIVVVEGRDINIRVHSVEDAW